MIPKILKNFSLFVDGRGYAGLCEEVTTPKLTIKTEDIRPAGFDIAEPVDVGMEKIELSFVLLEYNSDVLKQFGLIDGNSVQLTLRGAIQNDTSTSAVVIQAHGKYTSVDMGKFKAGEKSTLNCTLNARYYSVEIDGEKDIEIDVINMKRIINGVDQLEEIRNAIGI